MTVSGTIARAMAQGDHSVVAERELAAAEERSASAESTYLKEEVDAQDIHRVRLHVLRHV